MKQQYYEANRKARNDPRTTTPHEKAVEKYLKSRGIKYIREKELFTGSKQYFLDFYLIKENLGLEIDGGGHFSVKGRKKDRRKARMIMKYHGIPIIHIKNKEVDEEDFRKIDNPQIQIIGDEYIIKPKKQLKWKKRLYEQQKWANKYLKKVDWKALYKKKKEWIKNNDNESKRK